MYTGSLGRFGRRDRLRQKERIQMAEKPERNHASYSLVSKYRGVLMGVVEKACSDAVFSLEQQNTLPPVRE